MKITAQTEAVSSPPEEKWHWSQQWRQNTFRAGQKLKADWKKDLHNLGAGRKSRKPPTPFVGMKPYGKCQFTSCREKEYKPEAIVYLSKDGRKEPSERAFNNTNEDDVRKLLVKVAAYANKPGKDLVTGWLRPLLNESADDDLNHLLLNYIDILIEIGEHTMNAETENEFLEWLKIPSNHQYASRLASVYNDRIHLVLKQITNKYNDTATKWKYNISLTKAGPWRRGYVALIQVKIGSHTIQIGLNELNGDIDLWTSGVHPSDQSLHEKLKGKIASLGANGTRRFRWPDDEQTLYNTIDCILEFLRGPEAVDAVPQGTIH